MFTYDVFISYSHRDREFVDQMLIPRLQKNGFSFLVDYDGFSKHAAINDEIERAVYSSRVILFLITPKWLESNFTDFELQLTALAQRSQAYKKIVFLMRGINDPPLGFPDSTVVSLSSDDDIEGWNRLRLTLRSEQDQKSRSDGRLVNVTVILTREFDTEQPHGFGYACEIHVVNMLPGQPIMFDSIVIDTVSSSPPIGRLASSVRIFWSPLVGQGQQFSYPHAGVPFSLSEKTWEGNIEVLKLPAQQGVKIHYVRSGPLRTTVAGSSFVGIVVRLLLGANEVACKCYGVLPPASRVPQYGSGGSGFVVETVPDWYFSTGSGVLDPVLRGRILAAAYRYARDALLVSIRPTLIQLHLFGSTNQHSLHTFDQWSYDFYSEAMGTFSIGNLDPNWVEKGLEPNVGARPASWLSASTLESMGIDGNWAYLIPLQIKARPRLENFEIRLEMGRVEGRWRPVWWLPFERDGQLGICGDVPELVCLQGNELTVVHNEIWSR